MNGFDGIGARFWRSLLSIVVAYAVAIQSLLIAVTGFSLPAADAGQNTPAFELCLHDTLGAPERPASKPDSGCTHCIFGFAGAHHAVIGTAPAIFHRIDVAMVVVPWRGDASALARSTRYIIPSPRGPPFS